MGLKSFLQKIGVMKKEETSQIDQVENPVTEDVQKETPAKAGGENSFPKPSPDENSQGSMSSEPSSSDSDADFD